MDKDTTSRLGTWYRNPFGRRVLSPEPPYFVISRPSHREDRDALRCQTLADLAGSMRPTELLSES